MPSLGSIDELAEPADLGGSALDPGKGDTLGQICDSPTQDLVAAETEDVGDAIALAPAHRLAAPAVAVATDQAVDLGPAGVDAPDDAAQYQRDLGPVGRLAGAQDGRGRLARDRLIDVDRQEAAPAAVGVEQG